jgi:hypothetical protein
MENGGWDAPVSQSVGSRLEPVHLGDAAVAVTGGVGLRSAHVAFGVD